MNPAKKIRLEKLLNRRLSLPAEAKDYSYDDAIRLARFAIRAHPREPLLHAGASLRGGRRFGVRRAVTLAGWSSR